MRIPDDEIRGRNTWVLGKLEGNNPAGSVKDRPALSMIRKAEERGRIKPGDTLIEATSGNTGIALAMAAAIRGYKMVLLMPEDLSIERRQSMGAYGAEIVLTPVTGGMEYARDLAEQMQRDGRGIILDQFANPDNPLSHYETTGPEIWRDTDGRITHFVSAMGTTGTIMGVSQYLKEKNEAIEIVGAQPEEGSRIPGIRKWPRSLFAQDFRSLPPAALRLHLPGLQPVPGPHRPCSRSTTVLKYQGHSRDRRSPTDRRRGPRRSRPQAAHEPAAERAFPAARNSASPSPRAIAKRPTLLFADEPTSALDGENGQVVIRLLRRAATEHKAAR